MNIVPKDGGNRFSGSFFSAYTDKAMQGDNLTDDIIARGLRYGSGIDRIYDFNLAAGGPIKRDKLWFFASGRMWSVDAPVADTFVAPAGTPYPQAVAGCRSGALSCETGIDDQSIESALLRLTWQIVQAQVRRLLRRDQQGPRPRDERRRRPGHLVADLDLAALQLGGGQVHRHLSNQLLAEAGYSFNYEEYVITNQPGVNKVAFTPEWYAGASRRDQNVAALTDGLANWGGRYPDRFNMMGALSYITGSHNIKGGIQYNWGPT